MSDNNQDNQQAQPPEKTPDAAQADTEAKVNEQKTDDEGQDTGKEENKDGKKPEESRPKRGRLQERLGEITAKRRFAEADAASTREIIRELTGKEPPKPSDFKSTDEYNSALADYRQALAPFKAMQVKAERNISSVDQEYMQTLGQSWDERIADVTQTHKDWRDVVAASKVPLTPELTMAIMESDVGHEIAYHLAKNPEEGYDLLRLSPTGQARRIGQLEAKIQAGGIKPQPVPVSKAAPPVVPVSGEGAKPKINLGANLSLDEYRRARGLIK